MAFSHNPILPPPGDKTRTLFFLCPFLVILALGKCGAPHDLVLISWGWEYILFWTATPNRFPKAVFFCSTPFDHAPHG